jgi:hypothetical protein
MPFVKGDPRINRKGRPKGGVNKNRYISEWNTIGEEDGMKMLRQVLRMVRDPKATPTFKRKQCIKLLELHKAIVNGKADAPEEFKAMLLKCSREFTNILKGLLKKEDLSAQNRETILNFFLKETLVAPDKEKATEEEDDSFNQPVLTLAAVGGEKVVPLKKKK